MKLWQFLAGCCMSARMAFSSGESVERGDQALVDALADYGVDAHKYVDVSKASDRSKESASLGCQALCKLYPDQVIEKDTAGFTKWRNQFWSQQQSKVEPACIFQPSGNSQVAIALLLARLTHCPFAVKSGGHAAFAGASSIPDGLTIDLTNLNTITLSSDNKTAQVGTGNRWIDVYENLSPQGFTTIGGRVSNIGVGGLTLGGGISFYTAEHGFACDNVNNYEVVVADGRIINATPENNPDLYWALRGGGNNFGIVTKLDLAAYPAGDLWAGTRAYTIDQKDAIYDAVVKYAKDLPSDPKAALIFNVAYAAGTFIAATNIEYTKPVENPPIFDSFKEIPHIQDTMGIKTLPEVALEFKKSNPDGLRESYWTATVKLDTEMLSLAVDTFTANFKPIGGLAGIVPALTLQPLTPGMMERMAKNGGNALGLDPSEGPLLMVLVNCMWANEADDDVILKTISDTIGTITSKAKEVGKYNEYIYMNYASQYEDVISSYGSANKKRLTEIAEKYDPDGIFQTLQPGYFKLDGAPVPNLPS